MYALSGFEPLSAFKIVSMAISISRNIEESSKEWLTQSQVGYLSQPLIDIQLLAPDYSFFQKIAEQKKQWIVSSKWAVKWLMIHHQKIGLKLNDTVFCLSEKQANSLSEIASNVQLAEEKNTVSLSKLLQQKSKNELKIFLKGNRSLQIPVEGVMELDVYENSLLKPTVEKEFDAYLFFSPSGIESFIQGGNTIPEYSTIIAIGETTAQKARTEFSNIIHVSPKQSELEMIQFATAVLNRKQLNEVKGLGNSNEINTRKTGNSKFLFYDT